MADTRDARKSLEKDKGKRVADSNLDEEVPQESKKGIFVQMIVSGLTLTGDSRRAIKCYNRSLVLVAHIRRGVNFTCEILYRVSRVPDYPIPIIFTEKDAEGIFYPHDDALVISLKLTIGKMMRTLVSTGSSLDIIFKSTLDQLLIESPRITLSDTPFIDFCGDIAIP